MLRSNAAINGGELFLGGNHNIIWYGYFLVVKMSLFLIHVPLSLITSKATLTNLLLLEKLKIP